jgi:serine/threonine protein kinase
VARVLAGRYELEVPIGRGATGEVWRGRDISTRRLVAVKLVELADIENSALLAETIARFRREAATLAGLRHPNIIAALEAGRIGNELFLVMELAEGGSLASMLEQRAANNLGLFPVASVLRVAEQACSGLSAAHRAGVVHRDIKPSNLMVAARLHIKIIDFGTARLLTDNSPRLTPPRQAIGTLTYISPEQLSAVDVDGRADLYSLGCVLYELLAGRPPFQAEIPTALMSMQLQEQAVPLDSIRSDLPAGLSQLVDDLMEKDRSRRPVDSGEVLSRIEAISARLDSDPPENEADRQTVTRATSLDGQAGGAPPGPRQGQPPFVPEAGRPTKLTPERLADLSGPPTMNAVTEQASRLRPPAHQPQAPQPGTQQAGPGGGDGSPTWPDAANARPRRRQSRWRGLVSTLITAAIVAGIGFYLWQRTHETLKVTNVSVALNRPPASCSGTAKVVATIITNGKGGPVTYQWTLNSTAMRAATITVASGQDTAQVPLTWAFHGSGTEHALAELHVLSPNSAEGNTQFTYSCS